jgi:hypothetical protein
MELPAWRVPFNSQTSSFWRLEWSLDWDCRIEEDFELTGRSWWSNAQDDLKRFSQTFMHATHHGASWLNCVWSHMGAYQHLSFRDQWATKWNCRTRRAWCAFRHLLPKEQGTINCNLRHGSQSNRKSYWQKPNLKKGPLLRWNSLWTCPVPFSPLA